MGTGVTDWFNTGTTSYRYTTSLSTSWTYDVVHWDEFGKDKPKVVGPNTLGNFPKKDKEVSADGSI